MLLETYGLAVLLFKLLVVYSKFSFNQGIVTPGSFGFNNGHSRWSLCWCSKCWLLLTVTAILLYTLYPPHSKCSQAFMHIHHCIAILHDIHWNEAAMGSYGLMRALTHFNTLWEAWHICQIYVLCIFTDLCHTTLKYSILGVRIRSVYLTCVSQRPLN